MNLIDISHLKSLCSRIGIDLVTASKPGQMVMRFAQNAEIDVMKLVEAVSKRQDCLNLQAGSMTSLIYTKKNAAAEDMLPSAVGIMEGVVEEMI